MFNLTDLLEVEYAEMVLDYDGTKVKVHKSSGSLVLKVDAGPQDTGACNIDATYWTEGSFGAGSPMQVNWSAWGSQDPAVAIRYGNMLALAGRIAQDFNQHLIALGILKEAQAEVETEAETTADPKSKKK